MDVRGADHNLGKWSELPHRYRESRADQIFLLMASDIIVNWTVGRERSKGLGAVVSADVADNPHKRQHLSLERSFPAVKIGAAQSRSNQIRTER